MFKFFEGLVDPYAAYTQTDTPPRKLWPFLQRYVSPETAAEMPPLYLGYGLADRFAPNHRLLADALPEGHVFTTEGGHDWPQWSQLWRDMLHVLPLPVLAPEAPELECVA